MSTTRTRGARARTNLSRTARALTSSALTSRSRSSDLARTTAIAAVVALGAVLGGCATSEDAATRDAPTSHATSASAASRPALPADISVTAVSPATGSLSGGTEVTLTGTGLEQVSAIEVGEASIGELTFTDDALAFVMPASTDFATGEVALVIRAGDAAGEFPEARFGYEAVTGVDRQMAYLFEHWDERNVLGFGSLAGTDCVNFTSQGLLARGWRMDDEWWHSQVAGVYNDYGSPWISSTAFMKYVAGHPDLGRELADDELDELAVGDIAQFDYSNAGIRNHTGTVSRITGSGADREVFVVQHSGDFAYRPVAELLASHGGEGTVHYLHLAG